MEQQWLQTEVCTEPFHVHGSVIRGRPTTRCSEKSGTLHCTTLANRHKTGAYGEPANGASRSPLLLICFRNYSGSIAWPPSSSKRRDSATGITTLLAPGSAATAFARLLRSQYALLQDDISIQCRLAGRNDAVRLFRSLIESESLHLIERHGPALSFVDNLAVVRPNGSLHALVNVHLHHLHQSARCARIVERHEL